MTNFSSLDIEKVLYLHEAIIERAGGVQGVRDYTLLHSALERPKATFAGEDLYGSLLEKAAAVLHSLVMNHAFLDANKRTAFATMVAFLNDNETRVIASQDEIVEMCIAVDNEGWGKEEIIKWLKEHTGKV